MKVVELNSGRVKVAIGEVDKGMGEGEGEIPREGRRTGRR